MADIEKAIRILEGNYKSFVLRHNGELLTVNELIALLKAQEQRHRLEVHNIGNVDIPENVTEKQFHAVMNNVVAALEHTDKGESWPYDEEGR